MKRSLNVLSLCLFLLVVIPAIHAQQTFEQDGTVRLSNLGVTENTITGEVTNISNQPLKNVELTVLYLDPDDNVLGQEQVYPLQPGTSSEPVKNPVEKAQTLDAGETVQFDKALREIPEGWSPDSGKYEIRATRMEFDLSNKETKGAQQ